MGPIVPPLADPSLSALFSRRVARGSTGHHPGGTNGLFRAHHGAADNRGMRGVVAATAVLGVLAVGGLPAAALVVAAEETGTPDAAVAQERTGPPPWANGQARGHDKDKGGAAEDKGGAAKDKAPRATKPTDDAKREGAQRGRREGPPPGWGRHHQGRSPHGWAVREWARCLAGAAEELPEGRRLDPHAACGGKPEPPGHAKR
jgi:hypothetical protein